MLYHAYELAHAAVTPWRAAAQVGLRIATDSHNPWRATPMARASAAAFRLFENATRRYGKPEFGIQRVDVKGQPAAVIEETTLEKPFARLMRFRRYGRSVRWDRDPKVLIVPPMSGHFATLLRGTVRKMLEDHVVYLIDWEDARNVPLSAGRFGLDQYIDYVMACLREIGPGVTLFAVCQPGVPCLAATARMAEIDDPCRPAALAMMGSPIDTRISPTEPNRLAESRPLSWFRENVITHVPWPHAGFMRKVYPGFLQLSGFMSMNMDRHLDAHLKQFHNLVRGDGDSAASHDAFYEEYLSVMDLTEEFYLETIDRVFQRHLLPLGQFTHHDEPVNLSAITDVPLMTIEGGKDDITGAGQTHAAQELCDCLPDAMKTRYTHPEVGHYGQFNGGRWRKEIYPRLREFIASARRADQDAPAEQDGMG